MHQRVEDMRDKEVISISDGTKLGFVSDIEIDTTMARMTALVVYGRLRFFGLFGRGDDIVIPWENVHLIGDETILVDFAESPYHPKKKSFLSGLIEFK